VVVRRRRVHRSVDGVELRGGGVVPGSAWRRPDLPYFGAEVRTLEPPRLVGARPHLVGARPAEPRVADGRRRQRVPSAGGVVVGPSRGPAAARRQGTRRSTAAGRRQTAFSDRSQ